MTSDAANNITYATDGNKNLKFKITFTDASVYQGHAAFTVLSVSGSAQARYSGGDAHAYTFPRIEDANCYENFASPEGGYGATVTVEYSTLGGRPAPGCNPQFIRPLIVVEGYDASKFGHLVESNWNFRDFIFSPFNGGVEVDSDPVAVGNQWFGDRLEAAGYDLVFVDFNEGTGDISLNALLVENIIQWVNTHKIINPNTGMKEGNVVLGQRMGAWLPATLFVTWRSDGLPILLAIRATKCGCW